MSAMRPFIIAGQSDRDRAIADLFRVEYFALRAQKRGIIPYFSLLGSGGSMFGAG
jgi:hypothetical protein